MKKEPRRFHIDLRSGDYYLMVDLKKDDCNREAAHWHLYHGNTRVGTIPARNPGDAKYDSSVGDSARNECYDYTVRYRYAIEETYDHNRTYGAD